MTRPNRKRRISPTPRVFLRKSVILGSQIAPSRKSVNLKGLAAISGAGG
jgi:hypothetical protein